MKKTIAALAAAALLSGTFGVVAPAIRADDAPAAEEVVAGSSWSRQLLRTAPGGGFQPLGSSWS